MVFVAAAQTGAAAAVFGSKMERRLYVQRFSGSVCYQLIGPIFAVGQATIEISFVF